ncbi:hypothetical protein VP01_3864g1 [Puccinia sorghi]|uniref:Uncharacterized protein n=1 Tax=Puccinia sorghi TaxID=27349 RepID=A0A0L6UT08_9BASI|nr:hypothetical protein VP01_3864g1 [Puccinia sorghi]
MKVWKFSRITRGEEPPQQSFIILAAPHVSVPQILLRTILLQLLSLLRHHFDFSQAHLRPHRLPVEEPVVITPTLTLLFLLFFVLILFSLVCSSESCVLPSIFKSARSFRYLSFPCYLFLFLYFCPKPKQQAGMIPRVENFKLNMLKNMKKGWKEYFVRFWGCGEIWWKKNIGERAENRDYLEFSISYQEWLLWGYMILCGIGIKIWKSELKKGIIWSGLYQEWLLWGILAVRPLVRNFHSDIFLCKVSVPIRFNTIGKIPENTGTSLKLGLNPQWITSRFRLCNRYIFSNSEFHFVEHLPSFASLSGLDISYCHFCYSIFNQLITFIYIFMFYLLIKFSISLSNSYIGTFYIIILSTVTIANWGIYKGAGTGDNPPVGKPLASPRGGYRIITLSPL